MKFALGIEYDGSEFFGWQAQANLLTIQGRLEEALSKIADESIKVFCAGRTDAGVHATGQVVHFETDASRDLRAWTLGTNTHLPPTIAVRWAQEMDNEFHARFSALARRYRYLIYNHSLRPAILSSRVTWYYHALDIKPMLSAAKHLIGELDFSSFRSAQCESTTPMRNVQEITIIKQGDFVVIEIEANAFLHHMVRNIVGVLLEIGSGWKEPSWMEQVLHAKDRRVAAQTAPPQGLYLNKVTYPEQFKVPNPALGILLL
ncbi:MAG: tRNA pseudouridine(38-40) synthase TruA [Gammaproteobacteria bacterium]